MTARLKIKIALSVAIFVSAGSAPLAEAGTVAGTGGSTEVTQIMNNLELVTQTAQKAQSYALQLQQAVTNPNTPWSQTMDALNNVRQAYNTAQSVGYSMQSVESNFSNLYKGYGQSGNMLNSIINWGNQTRSAVQGALSSAGWTMDQVATEDALIDKLRLQGQTAVGQMQAAQVGNAISVELVQQLRQLRQLQAAQAQAQASYLAGINEKAAADDSNLRAFIPNRKALPQ
ncbi:P-type conjugative transfer protein TrbJ [Trinickia mobilis]|uniref:P-type conjugative transfer protein TrbJ n=1 Tax=Trinickia mobilis TaxID=2816356 RepID=UPI001A8C6A5A|nr:P-type conjugative transfer protein TrbJ [Trinickia mobilis]